MYLNQAEQVSFWYYSFVVFVLIYSSRMADDDHYLRTEEVSVVISQIILFKCINIPKWIEVPLVIVMRKTLKVVNN